MTGKNYTTLDELAKALRKSKTSILRRKEVKAFTFYWGKGPGGKEKRFLLSDLPAKYSDKVALYRTSLYMVEVSKQPEYAQYETVTVESIPGVKTQEMLIEERAEHDKLLAKGLKDFAAIPKNSPKKKRARARRWILEELNNMIRERGCARQAACAVLSDEIEGGQRSLPGWVAAELPKYHGHHGVKPATLAKWDLDYRNEGIMALVNGYGKNKGKCIISKQPDLMRLVLGTMFKAPQITGKSMITFLEAKNSERQAAEETVLKLPSQSAYEKFRKAWVRDNQQAWLKLINPDRYKNVCMAAVGSHFEQIERLNQLWELDSTPADWMLSDGRHSVVAVIDMFSRRLKYCVSKTSKSMAVCQVTRRAILDWGMPEGVRTDNGQDYVSDQYDLVLSELGIEHQLCIPFASEEKGTIERSMRTLSHGLLNLLPGFIGHNVADRKEIEARKSFASRLKDPEEVIDVSMSAADFQGHLDRWCEHIYGKDVHSGIGMSPFAKAQSYTDPIRRIEDERALDMLLCELAAVRKIGKKGIRFRNHTYFNEGIGEYIGKDVLVKYDEADIGRLYAYVEGRFIGVMQCYEILGISSREAAAATKHKQAKKVAEQTAELRKYKHDIKKNISETVMDYRIAESEKLIAFPQKSVAYSTDALKEAARAVEADAEKVIPVFSEEEKAVSAAIDAEQLEEHSPVDMFGADPARDFAFWKRLDARVDDGDKLTDREHAIWKNYSKSDEFRTLMEMEELFADNG